MARKRQDRLDELDLAGFHARLSEVLGDESETSFAARAKVSKSGLNRVVNGGMPSLDMLIAIASTAGVSIDWLATGRNDLAGFVPLSPLGVIASAGHGKVVLPTYWTDIEQQFGSVGAMRKEWLLMHGFDPMKTVVLTVSGDSMEPTLRDRDLLIIDRSVERIIDNGIYVVRFGDFVLVKRVQVNIDGSITLISENKSAGFDDIPIKSVDVDSFSIEGRVRWFGRSI